MKPRVIRFEVIISLLLSELRRALTTYSRTYSLFRFVSKVSPTAPPRAAPRRHRRARRRAAPPRATSRRLTHTAPPPLPMPPATPEMRSFAIAALVGSVTRPGGEMWVRTDRL